MRAYRDLRSGLALRASLSLAGAVVLIVAGIAVANSGIVDDVYPNLGVDGAPVVVTSYSGPYLTIAIGIGAIAGLLLVAAVTDFWRRYLIRPDGGASHDGLGQYPRG